MTMPHDGMVGMTTVLDPAVEALAAIATGAGRGPRDRVKVGDVGWRGGDAAVGSVDG